MSLPRGLRYVTLLAIVLIAALPIGARAQSDGPPARWLYLPLATKQIPQLVATSGVTQRDIYLVNLDGSGVTQLTNTPNRTNSDPVWSPDGSTIAFTTNRDGTYQVYSMRADGTQQTALTDGYASVMPAWSPDGARIAFLSLDCRTCPNLICFMNADGTGKSCLSNSASFHIAWGRIDWSPDGQSIAFVSSVADAHENDHAVICVARVDGSNHVCLTDAAVNSTSPAWSPDGKYIGFTTDRDSAPNATYTLYRMNADGSGAVSLAIGSDPVWSPDGSQIIFARWIDSHNQLYRMRADGADQTRITANIALGDIFQPMWRP